MCNIYLITQSHPHHRRVTAATCLRCGEARTRRTCIYFGVAARCFGPGVRRRQRNADGGPPRAAVASRGTAPATRSTCPRLPARCVGETERERELIRWMDWSARAAANCVCLCVHCALCPALQLRARTGGACADFYRKRCLPCCVLRFRGS
jgi:hypothetical protein